ncbi:MAG: hypothetical protein ACOVVK_13975 [Elsteraceae bacterium]
MATYVPYQPPSAIGRALFNFSQTLGSPNFRYSGEIRVSTSLGPLASEVGALGTPNALAAQFYVGAGSWTQAQLEKVDAITATYANFANINFTAAVNYPNETPSQIGARSDINISFIYRADQRTLAGVSAINASQTPASPLQYFGADGDVLLNSGIFGASGLTTRPDLSPVTTLGATLQHEIGHSLGLAHPHVAVLASGARLLSLNFGALGTNGFEKLGFGMRGAADLDKSYFTIMSYDQGVDDRGAGVFAQTPMILDVIALQEAYGAGRGTHGAGDDVVTPGGEGVVSAYRVYYDLGGVDTINLLNYAGGAMLRMGEAIDGASNLIGVSMSRADAVLAAAGSSPKSLRWWYGDYENATGGPGADQIFGNALANQISGGGGDDAIDGGAGADAAVYAGARAQYRFAGAGGAVATVRDQIPGRDGTDLLSNVEFVKFADQTIVAPSAVSALSVAVANQLALAYLGRGVSFDWRNAAALTLDQSGTGTAPSRFFSAAVADGALGTADSLETVVDRGFQNIFGFAATPFEQTAWADLARGGFVSREALPWALFVSYLGADNVPARYQVTAQSRLLALDAFTTAAQGAPSGAPGETNAAAAAAARAWLGPVSDPSSSALKILSAQSDVSLLAITTSVGSGGMMELIGVSV